MVSKANFDNFTKLNITKMEFTVRYTRQITALFTDISIKLNTYIGLYVLSRPR